MSSQESKDIELNPATSEESKIIQPIGKDTVHRICSGQVVLSLAIAVKELVENAIDAGANTIEVRLKEYGSEVIEVIDNGLGVEEHNFQALTLKHHTSKIRQFSDLSFVATLGFRGEALSSLCALSNLSVITRHKSAQCATRIEYDHNGRIKDKEPCARQIGTTVLLSNLFSSLPVRHKDFHKNIKREFSKMLELLYAYCIISGVRIICTNQTKKSPRTTVVATTGSKGIKENIICVFGIKQLDSIIEFQQHRPEEKILEEYSLRLLPEEQIPFALEGYISKCTHGCGRSSGDRQFYFINNRPCDPMKIAKVINEVYRNFNNNQYPFVVLNIKTEQSQIDVNVTPDKRQVFLEKEKLLLATIKQSLYEMFKTFPSTFKLQNLELKTEDTEKTVTSALDIFKHFANKKENVIDKRGVKRKDPNEKFDKKAKGILNFIYEKRLKIIDKPNLSEGSASEDEEKQVTKYVKESYNSDDDTDFSQVSTQQMSRILKAKFTNLADRDKYTTEDVDLQELNKEKLEEFYENDNIITSTQVASNVLQDSLYDLAMEQNSEQNFSISSLSQFSIDDKTPTKRNVTIRKITETPSCSTKIKMEKEKLYTIPDEKSDKNEIINDEIIEISYDTPKENTVPVSNNIISTTVSDIEKLIQNNLAIQESKKKETIIKFRAELTSENAEKELEKQISKDSFKKMKIIGQFNKGFIITRLDSDLFIIDQHATDEKYNFETLQQTTILENQILVNPKPLELTAANENILIDNIDIFTKNGFNFNINEDAESRNKISLTAIPMSKNYQFGKEDIDELLFMLQEDSTSTVLRPSRVRAMFASRACRKSVMIGSVLSKNVMKKLVDHMSEIDQPWNCPHGRPTMRHLVNLDLLQEK